MSDYGHAFEPLMSGGCCASSTKRGSSAKSKTATKTKAKTATGSKAKTKTATGAKTKTAKAKTGGGFVEDLGKLAIPLALIAAKEGVQHMYAKKKSSGAKKTTTTVAKKKTTTAGRRVAMGGSGSDYPMIAPTVGQQTGGFYYNDSPIAQPQVMPMPMSQSGGARASRNAALSREFRNMARDIAQMFRDDRKGR
jgi:hypothetical protein